MKKIKLFFIIFVSLSLLSCQTVKDGLSGKKSENSDEFLVQKKNPLVLPPEYLNLPRPNDDELDSSIAQIEDETNIKSILNIDTETDNLPSESFGNAEEFVLENIR